MFKLYENGQIMKVISDTHEVHHCMRNNINVSSTTTNANTLTQISIQAQIFDLEQQKYITDTTNSDTVEIEINGVIQEDTFINGELIINFESAEVGTFEIRVGNYKGEVVVNG